MKFDRWQRIVTGGRWGWLLALFAGCCIAASAGAAAQRNFASPEDAAAALVRAAKSQNRAEVLSVLGQDAAAWISSGDAAADRAAVARFADSYATRHDIDRGGDKATLILGKEGFPFAFPIVRNGNRWRFDTVAGKEEMLARRIGENELSVVKVLQAVFDAQMEYASQDRNGDGVLAYAQKFASSPGKHDGLYWPTTPGEVPSPLGVLVAQATSEGYRQSEQGPTPYRGYYYRMLMRQGPHAPSGAFDYVVKDRAIGGFAVIAYPAHYGNSGVMTFMMNQDGKIYQADLGPETQSRADQMPQFDPGQGWSLVQAP